MKQAVRWCRYELATPEYRDYSQTKWSNDWSKYFVLLIALLYTSVESMVEQALDIEVYESKITSRTSGLVTLYWDAWNGEKVVW